MRRNQCNPYNFISMLLILAMVLSGMCMNQISADSRFAYQTSQPVSTTLTILKTQPDLAVINRENTAGRHEALLRESKTRRTNEWVRSAATACLFTVAFLPLASVFTYGCLLFQHGIYSLLVTIRYIQCQDGKKPKLLF